MNNIARTIIAAIALLPAFPAFSQLDTETTYAIKADAEIGLGNSLSTQSALPGMTTKGSTSDFGLDFGYTFWRQQKHELEANIGLAFGSTTMKATLPGMDYHYSAPATADMDNEPYIRYYKLSEMEQKIHSTRIRIPIYLNYTYQVHPRIGVHALFGFKFGFNTSVKVSSASVSAESYGVYPQYDDLMIDATYMNEFGKKDLDSSNALSPELNGFNASIMAGIGAEVGIYGPVSMDVTLRYEAGMVNLYKGKFSDMSTFDALNSPVTYTVAEGETIKPVTDYLKKSKLSRLALGISIIYHF